MPILVVCPGCGAKMNAPDSAAGRKVRCPKPECKSVVPVPAAAGPVAADPNPDPFSGLGSDDARPRGKGRRDDDRDDDRPRERSRRAEDDDRPRSRRRDDEDDRPRGRSRGDDGDDRPRSRRDDRDEEDDRRGRRRRDDDEDDRPRSKSRRDDEDDRDEDRPRSRRRDDPDDEDDRPRRGRGRGKPGGGKKTWVVVAVVAGLVLLVGGGGYLVYRLVGGGKAAVPPGWREYTSAEDGFKGYFPKDVVKVGGGGGGGLGLPGGGSASSYTSGGPDDPIRVEVQVTRLPPGLVKEAREKMSKMMGEMQKMIPAGKGMGIEVRSVRWLGESATEVVTPDGVERVALTDKAVYSAKVSGKTNGRAKPEEEAAFFDNFTLK